VGYRPILVCLTSILLACFGASAKDSRNQADRPAWFWTPPATDQSDCVVGMCQPCLDRDASHEEARDKALELLAVMRGARIRSRTGLVGIDESVRHMGTDIEAVYDSTLPASLSESYDELASFTDGDLVAVLVGPRDDSGKIDEIGKYEPPDCWWQHVPSDDSCLYAVGEAPQFQYEVSSWRLALKRAMLELAGQVRVSISSLRKTDGERYGKVVLQEGDVRIRNWQIVARHYDVDLQVYYVLLRMPRENAS